MTFKARVGDVRHHLAYERSDEHDGRPDTNTKPNVFIHLLKYRPTGTPDRKVAFSHTQHAQIEID